MACVVPIVVTVITVNGYHGRLTRGFRVVLEGFEQVLFEFLHLLESFLFQVAERSSTCSSAPRHYGERPS